MRIIKFHIYEFTLPLKKPLNFKGNSISERKGLILKLIDADNNSGYGEVSPLPGFHKETLTEAFNQLKKLDNILQKYTPLTPEEIINGTTIPTTLYSSVAYGLDTAFINLFASIKQIPVHKLLSSDHSSRISLNSLLASIDKDYISEIHKFISLGYRTIKIKLGLTDLDNELKALNNIIKNLKSKVKLRLDVNAKWNYKDASYFLKSLDNFESLEYIEEPLSDWTEINRLNSEFKVPIALDENLDHYLSAYSNNVNALTGFVIKPPIKGKLSKTIQLFNLSKKHNKTCIISDTFQSALGLSFLASLSSTINSATTAMGLDTYRYFENIYKVPFKIVNGSIVTDSINSSIPKVKLIYDSRS